MPHRHGVRHHPWHDGAEQQRAASAHVLLFCRSSKCTHVLATQDAKLKRVHVRAFRQAASNTTWAQNLGASCRVNGLEFAAGEQLPLAADDVISVRRSIAKMAAYCMHVL